MRRYLHSVLNRPSAVNAAEGGRALDDTARNLNGGLQRQVFSSVSIPTVPSKIAHLLCVGSPSAIPRLVIPVIVNAINGMLGRRLWTHISIKVRKGGLPSFANGNPATAPKLKIFPVFVITPPKHSDPSSVLRRVGHAVNSEKVFGVVYGQAAARPTKAFAQVVPWNLPDGPAVAKTLPRSFRSLIGGAAQHFPTLKALTNQVFHFGHAYLANLNAKQIAIAGDYSK